MVLHNPEPEPSPLTAAEAVVQVDPAVEAAASAAVRAWLRCRPYSTGCEPPADRSDIIDELVTVIRQANEL